MLSLPPNPPSLKTIETNPPKPSATSPTSASPNQYPRPTPNARHQRNTTTKRPKQKHTYPVQENQSPNGGATDFQRGVPQMSIDVVEIF
jgi:hypothetical protein